MNNNSNPKVYAIEVNVKDLIDIHPTGIVRSAGVINYYYGVQPKAVQNLRTNDEFTVVYSTEDKDVWHLVRFSVLGDHKDYDILQIRVLEPAEIAYLEGELNLAKSEEQSNPNCAIASKISLSYWGVGHP